MWSERPSMKYRLHYILCTGPISYAFIILFYDYLIDPKVLECGIYPGVFLILVRILRVFTPEVSYNLTILRLFIRYWAIQFPSCIYTGLRGFKIQIVYLTGLLDKVHYTVIVFWAAIQSYASFLIYRKDIAPGRIR